MKKTIALLLITVFTFASCTADPETVEIKKPAEVTVEPEVDTTKTTDFEKTLEDVSGGSATGYAEVSYQNYTYTLYAEFEDLPILDDDYFYEGWVVRNSPLSVISTGPTEINDGVHSNNFTSEEDLRDHSFYVLTLEPNDGDPAPAEHILEGNVVTFIN